MSYRKNNIIPIRSGTSRSTQPSLHIGIAIISAFLIVTLLFIVFYTMSSPAEDDTSSSAVVHSSSHESQTSENAQPDEGAGATDPGGGVATDIDRGTVEDQLLSAVPEEPVFSGTAYLTFDDGPSLRVSPVVLDILAEEGIKATFFSLPYSGGDEIFRRIIDEGHELGNHSYSHDYKKLYEGTVSAFREDILKARRFIEDNFGYSTTSFRFPGGSGDQKASVRNPRIDAIHDLGYRYFDWDIDTNDWRRDREPEEIIEDVLNNTNGMEHVIILMHDMYYRTMDALPGIIAGLREQGYEFDILQNHPG